MAKYCEKCGKTLPDGAEFCSDCYGPDKPDTDAALFTRISAETEVWREPEPETTKVDKLKKNIIKKKKQITMGAGGVLAACLVIVIVVSLLPSSRVNRALKSGEYDRAYSIYTQTLAANDSEDSRVGKGLIDSAREICASFAGREITYDEADNRFSILYSFGIYTDGIDEQHSVLESLNASAQCMSLGEYYESIGSYIEAYNCYASVIPEDSIYQDAQNKLAECLDQYAKQVVEKADEHIAQEGYLEAISALKACDEMLISYGTYSAQVDEKLLECREEYEAFILAQAKTFAYDNDFYSAAMLLSDYIFDVGTESEPIITALGGYQALYDEQAVSYAEETARKLYDEGEVEAAFDLLDQTVGELFDGSALSEAVQRLEATFTEDTISRAQSAFGRDLNKLDSAREIVVAANETRPLGEIQLYIEYLDSLVPQNLATMTISDKSGTVFRSSGSFEAVDGYAGKSGWIWGRNTEYVVYDLNGKYDVLEGTFSVRRDDNSSVSGYFEVWCDGELAYTSETLLYKSDSKAFSVDISGCGELKIIFYCNYETSTAQGGYCHHGICDPVVTKNIEEFELWK